MPRHRRGDEGLGDEASEAVYVLAEACVDERAAGAAVWRARCSATARRTTSARGIFSPRASASSAAISRVEKRTFKSDMGKGCTSERMPLSLTWYVMWGAPAPFARGGRFTASNNHLPAAFVPGPLARRLPEPVACR